MSGAAERSVGEEAPDHPEHCARLDVDRLVASDLIFGDLEAPGPRSLDEAVEAFDGFIEQCRSYFTMWVRDIPGRVFADMEPNTAIDPYQPPSAMAGAWFSPMRWRLDDGEALLVELQVPADAQYSGFCVTDRWFQMVDPHVRQTSLNAGSGGRSPTARCAC